MTSLLPDTHSEPLLKVLHSTLQHFWRQSCDFFTNGKFQLFMTDSIVLNASTHPSTVFRSGIAPRRPTLNFRRKRRWTVTTESLFLKNCTTMLYVPMFHGYWNALSGLSAGSRPTSSTPSLPITSHLKNMRFLCSTLYIRILLRIDGFSNFLKLYDKFSFQDLTPDQRLWLLTNVHGPQNVYRLGIAVLKLIYFYPGATNWKRIEKEKTKFT
jgi:hypothetical protein